MKSCLLSFFILFLIVGCNNNEPPAESKKSHPSHKYHYVNKQEKDFKYIETLYVPVYSDIYYTDGTLRFHLTVTISVRNISVTDTCYLQKATYYDSYGKELKEFTDSTIMLLPLESFEFVVEEKEREGGAGANFIVEWGASKNAGQLLVQSVMVGTAGPQGISFLSESKIINQRYN